MRIPLPRIPIFSPQSKPGSADAPAPRPAPAPAEHPQETPWSAPGLNCCAAPRSTVPRGQARQGRACWVPGSHATPEPGPLTWVETPLPAEQLRSSWRASLAAGGPAGGRRQVSLYVEFARPLPAVGAHRRSLACLLSPGSRRSMPFRLLRVSAVGPGDALLHFSHLTS